MRLSNVTPLSMLTQGVTMCMLIQVTNQSIQGTKMFICLNKKARRTSIPSNLLTQLIWQVRRQANLASFSSLRTKTNGLTT